MQDAMKHTFTLGNYGNLNFETKLLETVAIKIKILKKFAETFYQISFRQIIISTTNHKFLQIL
jgi:hypothetical protein